jgi:hypothetical protein
LRDDQGARQCDVRIREDYAPIFTAAQTSVFAMIQDSEGPQIAREMAAMAGQRYSSLLHDANQRVAKWEWWTTDRYSLEPCYFELNKFVPGEPLSHAPDPPSGACGYAFDENGLLIAERGQTEFPGRCYQTFYVHGPKGIARYYFHYDAEHPWLSVSWLSRDEAGRVQRIDRVGAHGSAFAEIFEYDANGRVIRVTRSGRNPPYGDLNDVREIEYDEQGRVGRVVWVYADGRRVIDFERPAPDRTLSHCRDMLRDALTEAVLAALRNVAPDSPIAALALMHCDADYEHRLPPAVAFATEDELRPGEPPDTIWSPPDWSGYLPLQLDDQLSSLCDSVSNDIWQNELFAEADALLEDIARRLYASELPIPRSRAFVSFATAIDICDYADDVRRSASPETVALLVQKKLL